MTRVDSQPLYDALCPEWKLAPAPEPEERLSIVPLSSPVTAPGEPITFGVSLLRHGKPVSGIGLKCRMEREFHDPVEFPLPTRSAPVEVTTDLERPGFVRLEVKFGELTAAAGGGVSPLEIAGLPDVPGFDEFWRRQLALLRSVPMTVLKMEEIAPVLPEYADRVRCFDLRVACAGAKPLSAILAMPRHAAPRSCPAYAFFHGAGVRSAFQPLTWAAHGLIALNVNAHGIENNQPPEYYQELEKGELADYARRPVLEGEASPFRDMFLRVLRSLEFLRSLPEWDGKNLAVHGGSQGGLQALAATAFDPAVTVGLFNAPAGCDQLGVLIGRAPSWPGAVSFHPVSPEANRCAALFDGVSLARRSHAKAWFTVGFSDPAAVPSSVYAAFNAYGGTEKEIMDFPDCGHAGAVFWAGEVELLRELTGAGL